MMAVSSAAKTKKGAGPVPEFSNASDREIPYDEGAEQSALGAGMANEKSLARLIRSLRPEEFYFPKHCIILQGMIELVEAGTPVDPITLGDHLEKESRLRDVGGRSYLHGLLDSVHDATRVDAYAAIVRDHAQRRRGVKVAEDFIACRLTAIEASDLLRVEGTCSAPAGHALSPLDWLTLVRDGVPPVDYLWEPYIPRLARVWAWGGTGSVKSLWSLWLASLLSRRGMRVSYFSEENPLQEDLRRLSRLLPDPEFFRLFHRTGMDLADPSWVEAMLRTTAGDALTVFDSWTDLWSGDEGDNRAVQQFDATVLKQLQAQGVTPLTIHHSGHRNPLSERAGATAGRGASSLGQKADVTLEFKSEGEDMFTIVYGKSRIGGISVPSRTCRVQDEADGRLDIVQVESPRELAVDNLKEKMVRLVLEAANGYVTTNELRNLVGGKKDRQTGALQLLESDSRVRVGMDKVPTRDGKLRGAKVWRPRQDGGPLGERLPLAGVEG